MKKFPNIFYFMSAANFCFFLGNSFFILFPVYLKNLGASESYIGFTNNIDKMLVIIAAITIGTVIHRWDRIRLLRLGYLVLFIAFLSYLTITSLSWLIVPIRILHGIGFSLSMILGSTIIFESVPKERSTEAIGMYGISAAITNALSPAVGEFLLRNGLPHAILFIISVVLISLSIILTFFMPRINSSPDPGMDTTPKGLPALYRNREYALLSIAVFIFGGGFGVIMTFLPNFIRTTTDLSYSYFFMIYIAMLVLIRFIFLRVFEKINIHALILCVLFTGAVMNLLVNWMHGLVMLTIIGVLYGITHGVLYPVLNARLVGIVPVSEQGKSNALFTGTFNAGMMVFAFGLGFLIDFTGTYLAAFNVCAAAFILACVLAFIARK